MKYYVIGTTLVIAMLGSAVRLRKNGQRSIQKTPKSLLR
jgi:hypothetical protein